MNPRIVLPMIVLGDTTALRILWPHAVLAGHRLSSLRSWLESDVDTAAFELAASLLWLASAWVGLALLALLTRALPGPAGRAGEWIARLLIPSVMYRAAAGMLGASVLVAPAAADAATGTAAGSQPGVAATTPAPTWPTDPALPAPLGPLDPTALAHPAASADRESPTYSGDRATPAAWHIVQPGESLWSISRQQLGATADDPAIAANWPRWYAANLPTIGSDPDLLRPGTVLRVPPFDADAPATSAATAGQATPPSTQAAQP